MNATHESAITALNNYVFPNDLHVHWSMMIALYPYITGIVAGAFIVSSLYHVFKVKSLKPISRFSLLFALAFLTCATLPLFDSTNLSPKSLELDRKIIAFLAAIGIPMACVLHGYVGFIFGGIKANPTWATPLMPVIFLLSACVSGVAGIILIYILIRVFTNKPVDTDCVRTCTNYLAGFFILDFVFEMLEVLSHSYLRTAQLSHSCFYCR